LIRIDVSERYQLLFQCVKQPARHEALSDSAVRYVTKGCRQMRGPRCATRRGGTHESSCLRHRRMRETPGWGRLYLASVKGPEFSH
jgi:hypothetical protein